MGIQSIFPGSAENRKNMQVSIGHTINIKRFKYKIQKEANSGELTSFLPKSNQTLHQIFI